MAGAGVACTTLGSRLSIESHTGIISHAITSESCTDAASSGFSFCKHIHLLLLGQSHVHKDDLCAFGAVKEAVDF